jgi:hypothetical protein
VEPVRKGDRERAKVVGVEARNHSPLRVSTGELDRAPRQIGPPDVEMIRADIPVACSSRRTIARSASGFVGLGKRYRARSRPEEGSLPAVAVCQGRRGLSYDGNRG